MKYLPPKINPYNGDLNICLRNISRFALQSVSNVNVAKILKNKFAIFMKKPIRNSIKVNKP